MKGPLRRALWWAHASLGLPGGILFVLMGLSGAVPSGTQPSFLSCATARGRLQRSGRLDPRRRRDRNFAESDVLGIYWPAPDSGESRVRFRMQSPRRGRGNSYVIYDACARKILGYASLGWIDWIVDLHHDLLIEKNGKQWVGASGSPCWQACCSALRSGCKRIPGCPIFGA